MITFHCPSCGMKLQVPAHMAGVTGPCPHCSANISAPQADQQASSNAPTAAANPTPQHTTQQTAMSQGIPQPQQNQPQAPKQQQTEPARDTPRQGIPPNRQTSPPSKKPDSLPRKIEAPKTPLNWMRVIFPVAFLTVATITVLIVLQAAGIYEIYDLSKFTAGSTSTTTAPDSTGAPQDAGPDSPTPSVGSPTAASHGDDIKLPPAGDPEPPAESIDGEFPELQLPPPIDSNKPADDNPDPIKSPEGPTKPDKEPDKTPSTAPGNEPAPPNTNDQSPPTAGSPAYQVLTKFLNAQSLEERLPLMSKGKLTDEQLEKSCLAGPLAPVKSKRLATMVPRESDNMIQYLYQVSFQDETSTQLRYHIVVQLVERPGVHSPRVHATAFIEHYEKKFLTYGNNPSDKVTTFHCIAEVRTSIMAKNIPEQVKKNSIRLVIKTAPGSEGMFDAFLNKNSPLMDQIGPGKEFPYAKPKFCILSFRWNTSHPDMPYIELNDIVTTGWEK